MPEDMERDDAEITNAFMTSKNRDNPTKFREMANSMGKPELATKYHKLKREFDTRGPVKPKDQANQVAEFKLNDGLDGLDEIIDLAIEEGISDGESQGNGVKERGAEFLKKFEAAQRARAGRDADLEELGFAGESLQNSSKTLNFILKYLKKQKAPIATQLWTHINNAAIGIVQAYNAIERYYISISGQTEQSEKGDQMENKNLSDSLSEIFEDKTKEAAHGGGNKYDTIDDDKKFVDMAVDRYFEQKDSPGESKEHDPDPGDGEGKGKGPSKPNMGKGFKYTS